MTKYSNGTQNSIFENPRNKEATKCFNHFELNFDIMFNWRKVF